MIRTFLERARQGFRTHPFPAVEPVLPDRFRGAPHLNPSRCPTGCRACAAACPVAAIPTEGPLSLDLGRCLFCGACHGACPTGALTFTRDYRLAVSHRQDLVVTGPAPLTLARPLDPARLRCYRHSLRLRQVSAGGCNACEADANVLGTPVFDLARFGISFVASPRHANALLVTGPVSRGMREALLRTYDALPDPRVVIASGSCPCTGGPFTGHEELSTSLDTLLPVDLYVPGCPPHPWTLLDGLLRLLGRR